MCMFLAQLMYTKLAICGVSAFKIYGKHAVIMLPYTFSKREERE